MAKYIPYPMRATDAAIDISFLFADEKPAGKHGFLKTQGEKFVFEDGTPARFWGVCLNASANFPEHAHAEKLAKRLAKMGVNMVRMHQLDAEYGNPNIFRFSMGKRLDNTRTFDPESLERMDYLVSCFKKEGIYIYLDILVSRQFKLGDGVENAHLLGRKGPPASLYNRKLIELQKEHAENLFTHVNPYTGLAYKDEPAVVMTEIINEGTMFAGTPPEPYLTEFKQGFRKWLDENGIDYDFEGKKLFAAPMDPPLVNYKVHIEKTYFGEMKAFLRQIGVKVPITGTNYLFHSGLFASNSDMDFRDNHAYLHWLLKAGGTTWGEMADQKRLETFSLTSRGDSGFSKLFHMRSLDKPFFVSEWNMTWPNAYRAEAPVLYAAMAALQGISGMCIHTYSYNPTQEEALPLGKEIYADAIGSVPYREGIFAAWNDPALMGLFYHGALLLRRGDVAESGKRVAVVTDPVRSRERAPFLEDAPAPLDWYKEYRFDRMAPCYFGMAEVSKIGTCLEPPTDADTVFTEPQWPFDPDCGEVRSDTGELYRSWHKGYGTIDTPNSKCLYGFLEKQGNIELEGLSVQADTDFAVLALSSLSDDPICTSDNLLLTTVGRAQSHGAQFDGDLVTDFGAPPTEVEVIHAQVQLKTNRKHLQVYSITPEGYHQGIVPSAYDEATGTLTFRVGERWRSMYYLLQEG